MRLKSLLAACSLCLAPMSALADGAVPDYVQIPLASHHFGSWSDDDFNEFNPGLLLTWAERAGGLNYTIGAYKDSKSDAALHVSAAKMWDFGPYTQGGLVLGYIHSFGDGYTGIAPSLQINHRFFFVNIATGYDDGTYGVVGTGLTIPLGK